MHITMVPLVQDHEYSLTASTHLVAAPHGHVIDPGIYPGLVRDFQELAQLRIHFLHRQKAGQTPSVAATTALLLSYAHCRSYHANTAAAYRHIDSQLIVQTTACCSGASCAYAHAHVYSTEADSTTEADIAGRTAFPEAETDGRSQRGGPTCACLPCTEKKVASKEAMSMSFPKRCGVSWRPAGHRRASLVTMSLPLMRLDQNCCELSDSGNLHRRQTWDTP